MKSNKIYLYSLFTVFCLLFAVFLFGFNIYQKSKKRVNQLENNFNSLTNQIDIILNDENFTLEQFSQKMAFFCESDRYLTACFISTETDYYFAWAQNSSLLSLDENKKPILLHNSFFNKSYSKQIMFSQISTKDAILLCVYSSLDAIDIFYSALISFFIVLFVFTVTIIFLLSIGKKNTATEQISEKGDKAFSLRFETIKPSEESSTNEETKKSFVSDFPIDEISIEKELSTENNFAFETPTEKNSFFSEGNNEHVAPKGLFSPITGIGWEEYLETRLDAELQRAASSEQDMAFLIVTIRGLLHTDFLARKISSLLISLFKFNDLLFEFGSDGFACILQNVNLDYAMNLADELFNLAENLLEELEIDSSITIGVTTRMARLISAKKFISEAVSASNKAALEQSIPIVAFIPNPEKYKTYVTEKMELK